MIFSSVCSVYVIKNIEVKKIEVFCSAPGWKKASGNQSEVENHA